MKVTVLVYTNPLNPKEGLKEATKEEWNQILQKNKTVPKDQRRVFINDSFEDCGEIDCMYIETTHEEYKKWVNSNTRKAAYRNRILKEQSSFVSLSDTLMLDGESITFEDIIEDKEDMETKLIDNEMLKNLRIALAKWNDWANEMLDYYLDGKCKSCSGALVKKYGLSYVVIARRKKRLNQFILDFFDIGVKK